MVEIGCIYQNKLNDNYYIYIEAFVKFGCVRVRAKEHNCVRYELYTKDAVIKNFIKTENKVFELEMLLNVYD